MNWEPVCEGLVVGSIAGISALVAISATSGGFPSWYDAYTSGLAAVLAGLVRYATLRGYKPKKADE